MKHFFLLAFLSLTFIVKAQTNLNDYKYVIVPKRLADFKKENQYQTSTLLKFLLVKKNFSVVYEDNLPDELKFNRCLGLIAEMNDTSSMFSTLLSVSLMDCNNKEVFKTKEGISKEKEFKTAYNEALREAMESFSGVSYQYSETDKEDKPITVSFKNDVKQLEPEKEMPQASTDKILTKTVENDTAITALYAQAIPNGYQLVDSTPKITFKIFSSSLSNVYHATFVTNNTSGILYENEGNWVFEYYENGQLLTQNLSIKF